ncbi:hypothetical protein GCM10008938_52190 [Deinococcus roseus]|uniref:Uncharacterized protein n=1 Tax=Deinococcus roseus TaxID=392414 RepID=A0ABQ2DJF0_9DEIO|nr:hypothetical protein GCM10008938_52190 [Deinococcus roseus]
MTHEKGVLSLLSGGVDERMRPQNNQPLKIINMPLVSKTCLEDHFWKHPQQREEAPGQP